MSKKIHKLKVGSEGTDWNMGHLRMLTAIPDVPLPANELAAFEHFTENLLLRELGLPHDLKPDEAEIADAGINVMEQVEALARNGG